VSLRTGRLSLKRPRAVDQLPLGVVAELPPQLAVGQGLTGATVQGKEHA